MEITDNTLIMGMVSCPSKKTAKALAKSLIQNQAAACVQILGPMESFFVWEGKASQAREFLILIKTSRAQEPRILDIISQNHPYEVPEVLFFPVSGGLPDYLEWVQKSLR